MDEEGLFKRFLAFLRKEKEQEVIKSVEQEERKALFVTLEPDVFDLHGDTYSAKEVESACASFNLHCRKANLFHRVETEKAIIEQSYTAPADFILDTPEGPKEIKKGTWLQQWYFPPGDEESDMLWKMVKDGEITGISIGAYAKKEEINE